MKVKLLTGLSGVGFSRGPGELHECGADEAERLIAAGFAEAVEPEKPVEQAKAKGRKLVERAKKLIGGSEQRG